jgi:hypothetical protein
VSDGQINSEPDGGLVRFFGRGLTHDLHSSVARQDCVLSHVACLICTWSRSGKIHRNDHREVALRWCIVHRLPTPCRSLARSQTTTALASDKARTIMPGVKWPSIGISPGPRTLSGTGRASTTRGAGAKVARAVIPLIDTQGGLARDTSDPRGDMCLGVACSIDRHRTGGGTAQRMTSHA